MFGFEISLHKCLSRTLPLRALCLPLLVVLALFQPLIDGPPPVAGEVRTLPVRYKADFTTHAGFLRRAVEARIARQYAQAGVRDPVPRFTDAEIAIIALMHPVLSPPGGGQFIIDPGRSPGFKAAIVEGLLRVKLAANRSRFPELEIESPMPMDMVDRLWTPLIDGYYTQYIGMLSSAPIEN